MTPEPDPAPPVFPPSAGQLEKLREELAAARADLAAEKKRGDGNDAKIAQLEKQVDTLLQVAATLKKSGNLLDLIRGR